MTDDLTQLTIKEASRLLRLGSISAADLVTAHVQRIERLDQHVKAFLRFTPEVWEKQADEADRRLRQGDAPPLCGIPLAVKDVLCVRGVETTAGSQILKGFRPPYTATAVARLFEAGAVMLGVTNCDEFAMGSSTENSGYFPTRNPWDLERVPGGSSGGSAAAVAAGEAMIALGSDTGGSIRQPAALCGVVGMKPTYGRVSRYGLIAFASSLDQIGPFARSVDDAAITLSLMSGLDPLDATSSDRAGMEVLNNFGAGVKGMRLGVPREYYDVKGIEPGVKSAIDAALAVLRTQGAEVVEVSLPHTDYGLAAYYIIAPAECSSNLARFDGVRYGMSEVDAPNITEQYLETRRKGFGSEVRRRVMLGTYALSSGYYDAYYLKAQKVRTLIKRDFDEAFKQCDAIVSATSPTVAFPIGSKTQNPLSMYLCDVLTLGGNLAGLPGISVPCGTSHGLPVGLQVLGPQWGENVVLRVARSYEEASGVKTQVADVV
ncbi:MAG: Asp-tRNA(Asn)/Glu-tRNA(Gln) amidotransferase subunit GatA [Chloroflexi bacterium]|nr:MAG: aspartyl/glutamyl-tRNA amidotransferase subunit A [Chloroflexi bacterium 13_1_40CM_66_19]TMF66447.1 MAG: Asp-tRNA(Asn)/Glu-tRNA(Gln) amidotransferase subunit GatA [Chloroflexota bacterium]TMG11375.1 MAG: Asp-tRNA(Asn)/Glu-tRNA(Gln) amidotransferase subunit GatA [Chloroflexota bacterium]